MMYDACTQLSIVDLAGSERASKTGASPEQLRVRKTVVFSLSSLILSVSHTNNIILVPYTYYHGITVYTQFSLSLTH